MEQTNLAPKRYLSLCLVARGEKPHTCELTENKTGHSLTGKDNIKCDSLHMKAHDQTGELWFFLKQLEKCGD